MTAEIVELPARRPKPNPGNGAREALIDIAMEHVRRHAQSSDLAVAWADDLLVRMWMRGFRFTPIDYGNGAAE